MRSLLTPVLCAAGSSAGAYLCWEAANSWQKVGLLAAGAGFALGLACALWDTARTPRPSP